MGDSRITRRTFVAGTALAGAGARIGRPAFATTPAVTHSVSRPRLYFSANDIAQLRRRFRGDPLLQKAQAELLDEAKQVLSRDLMPERQAIAGKGQHGNYYTESIAHNTVLVDDQGQPSTDGVRGTKFPGRLYGFHDAPNARYVLADATGPMAHLCRRFLRHFLWLDGSILLVDDLLAHKTASFAWLFHGETPPVFADGVLTLCHAVLVRRTDGSGVEEVYVQCADGSHVRIASDDMPRRVTINGRRVAGEMAVRRGRLLEFPAPAT